MEPSCLLVEKKEHYAVVTMHRPGELNALTRPMREALDKAFAELEQDDEVRAVILTGGDYVFSAGMDIQEMSMLADEAVSPYFNSILSCLLRIYTYPKPVVAVVGGIALGGGFNLATVCDFIVASESAIFGHPELKFGFNPLFSPLQRRIGSAKAKEVAMLGEPIGAKEAYRIGLVNKVAQPEFCMAEAVGMVEKIVAHPASVCRMLKQLSTLLHSLDKRSALEMEFNAMVRLFSTPERKMLMCEAVTQEYLDRIKRKEPR